MGVRALHRKVLLEALAEELSPGTIRFSSKLAAVKTVVSEDSSTATLLELEDGTVIRAKVPDPITNILFISSYFTNKTYYLCL